mmetsp:Transcript_86722/g.169687  ORF Transcript_86722/g.169687 Transcript_86722/m.169687 type:complete len:263 (-) Transcript_86722:130-918(-)
MCWSLEVSVITLVLELLGASFIVVRSFGSKVPEIQGQKYHMIAFLSIILVETVEVLLWMNPDELRPIEEAALATCSSRNTWLTRLLYPNIMLQAYLFLFVIRSDNDPNVNKDRLNLCTNLTFYMYALLMIGWFAGEVFDYMLVGVESSGFHAMAGKITCSYIGKQGHLHWVFKTSTAWFLPTAGVTHWGLLGFFGLFAGFPLIPHAIPVLIQLFWFACSIVYTGGSAEAGSIWCWTGCSLVVVELLLPYFVTFPSQMQKKDC